MSYYLKRWLHQCQPACCFSVLEPGFFAGRLCTLSYSCSAQDVSCWSSLLMSPKDFTCFPGCYGGLSTALVTTSIYRVPFSALRCFLQDTCFIRLQSATPDDETYHTEAVHSLSVLFFGSLIGIGFPLPSLFRRFRQQRAPPQRPFLHQHEEHRNQNQYVNRGRNHSADHRSGNRLHHVGTNTTRPENGNQAGENGGDRHKLWPEPMHSTLNGGLVNIGVCEWAV